MSDDYDWETKQRLATLEHWKARAEKAEAKVEEAEKTIGLLQGFAQAVRNRIGDDEYYMIQDQVWKANGLDEEMEIKETER